MTRNSRAIHPSAPTESESYKRLILDSERLLYGDISNTEEKLKLYQSTRIRLAQNRIIRGEFESTTPDAEYSALQDGTVSAIKSEMRQLELEYNEKIRLFSRINFTLFGATISTLSVIVSGIAKLALSSSKLDRINHSSEPVSAPVISEAKTPVGVDSATLLLSLAAFSLCIFTLVHKAALINSSESKFKKDLEENCKKFVEATFIIELQKLRDAMSNQRSPNSVRIGCWSEIAGRDVILTAQDAPDDKKRKLTIIFAKIASAIYERNITVNTNQFHDRRDIQIQTLTSAKRAIEGLNSQVRISDSFEVNDIRLFVKHLITYDKKLPTLYAQVLYHLGRYSILGDEPTLEPSSYNLLRAASEIRKIIDSGREFDDYYNRIPEGAVYCEGFSTIPDTVLFERSGASEYKLRKLQQEIIPQLDETSTIEPKSISESKVKEINDLLDDYRRSKHNTNDLLSDAIYTVKEVQVLSLLSFRLLHSINSTISPSHIEEIEDYTKSAYKLVFPGREAMKDIELSRLPEMLNLSLSEDTMMRQMNLRSAANFAKILAIYEKVTKPSEQVSESFNITIIQIAGNSDQVTLKECEHNTQLIAALNRIQLIMREPSPATQGALASLIAASIERGLC